MSLQDARSYAAEHLASVEFEKVRFPNGLWRPKLQEYYGLVTHGGVNPKDRNESDIWFEITEENAQRLVEDSRGSADAWDLARSVCINNLLRERPLAKALRDFVCSVLINRWPRPRASETYNNAKRDVVLSQVIFEVWLLFDLSENKACKFVKQGAYDAGFDAPAELIDIWRNSEVKKRGLPERTSELKDLVRTDADSRLAMFLKLKS